MKQLINEEIQYPIDNEILSTTASIKDNILFEMSLIEHLNKLWEEENYEELKQYVRENNEFRVAVHEAAHAIIYRMYSIKYKEVYVGKTDEE